MNPAIVGKILNIPVIEPEESEILSGASDPDGVKLVVRRGLVRFGSKGAFLGCPMFHEGMAYAEAVVMTLTGGCGTNVDMIFEGADALEELIASLRKAADKFEGYDTRYDQIVGFEQIWDAAQDETREELKKAEAADIEIPDGFMLCPKCVGDGQFLGSSCLRCGGEMIVVRDPIDPENVVDAGGF